VSEPLFRSKMAWQQLISLPMLSSSYTRSRLLPCSLCLYLGRIRVKRVVLLSPNSRPVVLRGALMLRDVG